MAVSLAFFAAGACAQAQAPSRDTIVETQLLPRSVKASLRRVAAAAALPEAERLEEARRLILAGRALGDPRTLGYAESLLEPWPAGDPGAPVEALVLRATIEQSRHRFDAALSILDRVLAQAPAQRQALLTRATIAQVRGDYTAARGDCARLRPLDDAIATICDAITDALTGSNERAAAALRGAAGHSRGATRAWALAALAQVDEQGGDATHAVHEYRASLGEADDLTTRLALSDLLIAQAAWGDARALLAAAPPADGVLLRRLLVERALGSETQSLAAQLQARFDEAIARGELLHAREAALFALARGDGAAALRFARDNWAAQREPADLIVLARAAHAAGDRAALAEVRGWIARTGLSDVRVNDALHGS